MVEDGSRMVEDGRWFTDCRRPTDDPPMILDPWTIQLTLPIFILQQAGPRRTLERETSVRIENVGGMSAILRAAHTRRVLFV